MRDIRDESGFQTVMLAQPVISGNQLFMLSDLFRDVAKDGDRTFLPSAFTRQRSSRDCNDAFLPIVANNLKLLARKNLAHLKRSPERMLFQSQVAPAQIFEGHVFNQRLRTVAEFARAA